MYIRSVRIFPAAPLTFYQLDADVLDSEIDSLFSAQLRRAIHFAQILVPAVSSLQPEVQLLIRYYVYKHSLLKHSATPGQRLLDLRLVDSNSFERVSDGKLMCYGLFTLTALPYLSQRCVHLLPHKSAAMAADACRIAELLNFVVFLTNGKYRCMSHRLLSIACTHSSAAAIFSPVNYDFMSREMLWFTFAEFLSFLMPLVNPVKVKNFVCGLLGQKSSAVSLVSPGIRSRSDLLTCAVCNQSPVNAREIGCNHCFCYYCITTTCLADESYGFSCPKCGFHIREFSEIRELYLKGF